MLQESGGYSYTEHPKQVTHFSPDSPIAWNTKEGIQFYSQELQFLIYINVLKFSKKTIQLPSKTTGPECM